MKRLAWIALVALVAVSCGSSESGSEEQNMEKVIKLRNPKDISKEERLTEIRSLEEELKNGGDQPDAKIARKLMAAYMEFSNFQREEPETPDFLFKAAELARYIGRPKKAIDLYSDLFNGFPSYPRRVETLNLIAFIYDYDLNEKEKASETYAMIIENFPDHKLADDARARLETIDLSDEELIELFKQRNQTQ